MKSFSPLSSFVAYALAFAAVATPASATQPPVLNTDSGALGAAPGTVVGPQSASLDTFDRGTSLDGAMRSPPPFPWAIAADPVTADVSDWRMLGPVDLAAGRPRYHELQMLLPAHAPWPVGVTWTGSSTASTVLGPGWYQMAQPSIKLDDRGNGSGDDDLIYFIYDGDAYAQYKRNGSSANEFVGINGATGVFQKGTDANSNEIYTYTDPAGTEVKFFGFSGLSLSSVAYGQLWKYQVGTGTSAKTAYAGHPTHSGTASTSGYDGSGRLTTAYDSADRKFTFTYSGSPSRLTVVEASEPAAYTNTIARVDYAYYSSTSTPAYGVANGLSHAITSPSYVELDGHELQSRFYYTSGGKLKTVVGHEGVRLAIAKGESLTPTSVGDIEARSEFILGYDGTSGKVNFLTLAGMNGGTMTGEPTQPTGEYHISYGTPTSSPSAPLQDWGLRAVVQFPWITRDDTTTGYEFLTRYFTQRGEGLSTVTSDADPAGSGTIKHWVTAIERDSEGRIEKIHSPANLNTYTHNSSGNPSGAMTFKSTAGVVTHIERNTGSSDPLKNFISGVRRRVGTSTSNPLYYVASTNYASTQSVTIGGATLYRPLVTETRSHHTAHTDRDTATYFNKTAYSETFWGSSLVRKTFVTTNPEVSSGQNGSGASTTRTSYFDELEQARFTKVENNRLSYFEYDAATALLTREIADVDTDTSSSSHPGYGDTALAAQVTAFGVSSSTTLAGESNPYHRKTSYLRDTMGRITQVTDPASRRSINLYYVFPDGKLITVYVPRVSGSGGSTKYFGPASVTVTNYNGIAIESGLLQLGTSRSTYGSTGSTVNGLYYTNDNPVSTPWLDLATSTVNNLRKAPSGTGRTLLSLNEASVMSSDGSRVIETRRYHTIPSPATTPARDTHFDLALFDYNNMGQLTFSRDFSDTIREQRYDAIGRPTQTYMGVRATTGTPGEFQYASQPGSAPSSIQMSATEYDGGGVGNGLVTQSSILPGVSSPSRTVRYGYNAFDYPVATAGPSGSDGPHYSWTVDNLGRTIDMGVFSSTSGFNFSTSSFPTPSVSSPPTDMVSMQHYDWDAMDRVYRDSTYGVDSTGSSPSIEAQPVQTDHFYGPMGGEMATVGTTISKTQNNRMCEVKFTVVVGTAPASTGSGGSTTYTAAVGGVQSNDTVLSQTLTVRDIRTGFAQATVTAERPPLTSAGSSLVCDGPLIDFAYGETVPSSGGIVHIAYNVSDSKLRVGGTATGPAMLRIAHPNEFDQPWRWEDYGDLHERSITGPICCGTNPCDPPSSTPVIFEDLEYDPRLILCKSVKAEYTKGTTVARTGSESRMEMEFDAAGRLIHREKTYTPLSVPADLQNGTCCGSTQEEDFSFDRDRLWRIGMLLPGPRTGCTSTTQYTEFGYPGVSGVPAGYPPNVPSGWSSTPWYNNRQPRWQTRPGSAVGTSWGSSPPANLWKTYKFNALGEVDEYANNHMLDAPFTGSGSGARGVRITYDRMGRPTDVYEPQPIPAHGTDIRTTLTRDGLGRLRTATRSNVNGSTVTDLDSMEFQYGPWGLKKIRQMPQLGCEGGGPTWDQDISMELPWSSEAWQTGTTCGGSGRSGWRAPYMKSRTLPGNITLNINYSDRSSSNPVPTIEQGIDRLIRRPTGVSWTTGSGSTPLAEYAYHGIAKPSWKSLPESGFDNWLYIPNKTIPGTNPPLREFLNPDFFVRPQYDVWLRSGDPSSTTPSSSRVIQGIQYQWEGSKLVSTWNFGRSTYPGSAPTNPLPSAMIWTPQFDQRPGHEFTQHGCNDEPLIWCRALDPAADYIDTAGPTNRGDIGVALASAYAKRGNTGTANMMTAPGMGEVEMYDRDCRGNPLMLMLDRDGSVDFTNPMGPTRDDVEDLLAPGYGSGACQEETWEEIQRRIGGELLHGMVLKTKHDSSGNLTDDGWRHRYKYDCLGRLVEVYSRVNDAYGEGSDGAPIARIRYNALGWRTSIDYNLDKDEDYDGDDLRELYQYDEQWRLTGIYRQAVGSCDTPCLYQVYSYDQNTPVGMIAPLTPNHRWRDKDCDGEIDEELDILTDRFGNVRALSMPPKSSGASGVILEHYDYTPFGRPLSRPLADLSGDGKVDGDDDNAMTAAYGAYTSSSANYDPRADLDHDGDVDSNDHYLWESSPLVGYNALKTYDSTDRLGIGDWPSSLSAEQTEGLDLRIGYRGYQWDPMLKTYHCRNRDYDPVSQRWSTPDPIGAAGGDSNWYRYVGNHPETLVDPFGLDGCDIRARRREEDALRRANTPNPTTANGLQCDSRGVCAGSVTFTINTPGQFDPADSTGNCARLDAKIAAIELAMRQRGCSGSVAGGTYTVDGEDTVGAGVDSTSYALERAARGSNQARGRALVEAQRAADTARRSGFRNPQGFANRMYARRGGPAAHGRLIAAEIAGRASGAIGIGMAIADFDDDVINRYREGDRFGAAMGATKFGASIFLGVVGLLAVSVNPALATWVFVAQIAAPIGEMVGDWVVERQEAVGRQRAHESECRHLQYQLNLYRQRKASHGCP